MNQAGYMRIGAMLAVLTVLAGAFVTMPYWTARAEDKAISGYVETCGGTGPDFLPAVTVSLISAHTGQIQTTTTIPSGYYIFTPAPASYQLRFEVSTHYTRDLPPFRFDGSLDVLKDACMDRMPNRDRTLKVLVVDSTQTLHSSEPLSFASFQVTNEDIDTRVNGTGVATTVHAPVVSGSASFHWRNASASFELLSPGDYTWSDLFTGTIVINNSNILTDIALGTNNKWLNATYQWSQKTTRTQYFPIVPGSESVMKGFNPWPAGAEWNLNPDTGTFEVLANFVFGTDSARISYSSTNNVTGASVSLFNTTANQTVSSGTTDVGGYVTFSIWANAFQLEVEKEPFEPYTATVDTGATNSTRAVLIAGVPIYGIARRADRPAVPPTGVVGFLYNTNPLVPEFRKVLTAKIQDSLYIFYAERNQYYKMVIDADGYKAKEVFVSTASGAAQRIDSTLPLSLKEEYRTDVWFSPTNWSAVTIRQEQTLRPDSSIPGLKFPEIRSLSLQVDYERGNKDGNLSDAEGNSFTAWLQSLNAPYVTTDRFSTTNGIIYNSSQASFLQNATDFRPGVSAPTAIFLNSTATYTPRGGTIPNGKPTYYVNLTTQNDQNETVYQDQVVDLLLPRGYEMTDKKVTGPITTTGWTRITVDAGLTAGTATSQIDMTIRKSLNGTARAAVVGPIGKFHVLSDTDKNYTAVVAAGTNITFSAEQSIDPIGNIQDANFTWRFTNNTVSSRIGYNITSIFNYTASILAVEGHEFTVNLTVVEAGGNRTYRDIKIFVDDTPPVAAIKTNRTTGDGTGMSLVMDEDSPIKFDGSLSFDSTYASAPYWVNNHTNRIPDVEGNRGYRWDWDANHIMDSNLKFPVTSFEKPGWYNSTLQVVDWVGHTSTVNATIYIVANDRTKPTPNFVILDPSRDWIITTSLTEGKNYSFNASSSTDNYDESRNLSYAWRFPGPVTCTQACAPNGTINSTPGRDGGWNVTVRWSEFNVSYNVTLNVTDTGFLGRTPNYVNLTSGIAVAVDLAKHPDLKYVAASLKIEPGQPEEGQVINVSFMIANDLNRANATSVRVILEAKDANGVVVLQNRNPEWRDEKWNLLSDTEKRVNTGTKVRLIFLISFPAQGNKTLEIKFNDTTEPYTWVDGQNRITGSVFAKLAGWVIPLVIIGFIVLVIAVAFGARTYSRYRSGELVFRRKEKKEKKGKKKLEDEEEAAEPEEDAKGKKRL